MKINYQDIQHQICQNVKNGSYNIILCVAFVFPILNNDRFALALFYSFQNIFQLKFLYKSQIE